MSQAGHDVPMRGRIQYDDSTPRSDRHDYWGVVLDAPDAHALGDFYVRLLGWEVAKDDDEGVAIAPPEGVAYLAIQDAPSYEPPAWPAVQGRQQMMMHLDVEVEDLDAAVVDAIEMGATVAEYQPQDEVRVLLDPAGHPFCLYLG